MEIILKGSVMIMADVFAITAIVLGFLVGMNALLLLCRGLWPEDTIDATHLCSQGLSKNFFWGLIPTAIATIFMIIGGKLGPLGKIVVPGIICVFLMYASIGLAGFVSMLGHRLMSNSSSHWKPTLFGGTVFSICSALPILGWFVLLPLGMVIGCGAQFRVRKYRAKANANSFESDVANIPNIETMDRA